jgi:hypothetical protein
MMVVEEQEIVETSLPAKTSSKTKNTRQAPVPNPRSFESLKWEEKLRGGYRVKFRNGTKLVTIFRFLLAKVLYDTEDGLRLDEYLALMEAYLRLRDHRDPTFLGKYGEWLITIQPFIASLAEVKIFPLVPKKRSPELERILSPLLPSPSAYFGYKGNPLIRQGFSIHIRNPFVPASKLPPPRFIGVGYRDKGTRRKPELDGSPRWQDVAMRIPVSEKPTFETTELSWKPKVEKSEIVSLLKENLTVI